MKSTPLTLTRRLALAGFGALALAAACSGPPEPGSAALTVTALPGANPAIDGTDRPLTLQILQLRGTGALDAAPPMVLMDPVAALGADLIQAESMILPPGGSASTVLVLDPATTSVAVVAGYRDPMGKTVRAKAAVSPTADATFIVTAGPSGITMVPG